MSDTKSAPCKVLLFAGGCFVLPSLQWLVQHNLLAAVILPDPQQHPAIAIEIHQLIAILQQHNIPFYICASENLVGIQPLLIELGVNTGLICTYPSLLPESLLNSFRLGIYNIHASALPAYPGPMPLYWQIRNGEEHTAVVIHKAEIEADSGAIVVQQQVPIDPLDTIQSLGNILAHSACAVVETLIAKLQQSNAEPLGIAQVPLGETKKPGKNYARRVSQADALINWQAMTAENISALCRAGAGQTYAAYCLVNGVPIQIIEATPVPLNTYATPPGTVLHIGEPEGLVVTTAKGAVRLDIIASSDGWFSGLTFSERFHLDAGMSLAADDSLHRSIA